MRWRLKVKIIPPTTSLAVACIISSGAAAAQDTQGGVTIGYEAARDRFHYRFENPSRFDTPELVPHEFTQTYVGDNQWLTVRARYRLGGRAHETTIAATAQRTTRGDDFDTFFQPTGDVVVSGTTGNVSMRSLRLGQHVALGQAAGLHWHVGYEYQRDRMVFHPGQKIVSHTLPPSRETSLVTTRETTISETHQVRLGLRRQSRSSGTWRVGVGVDLAPTTNARLTTRLPDKYPGQDIVFSAIVLTLSPTLTITRASSWPLSARVGFTRTFSYLGSRQFQRHAFTVGIGVGYSRSR